MINSDKLWGSRDITSLINYMNLQYHVIKGSLNYGRKLLTICNHAAKFADNRAWSSGGIVY